MAKSKRYTQHSKWPYKKINKTVSQNTVNSMSIFDIGVLLHSNPVTLTFTAAVKQNIMCSKLTIESHNSDSKFGLQHLHLVKHLLLTS